MPDDGPAVLAQQPHARVDDGDGLGRGDMVAGADGDLRWVRENAGQHDEAARARCSRAGEHHSTFPTTYASELSARKISPAEGS